MLLASETSIQLTNALEKLIDSGIQLGERVLGALIIFIIGKFLVNWLNRLFARNRQKSFRFFRALRDIVNCLTSQNLYLHFVKNSTIHLVKNLLIYFRGK